MAKEKWRLSDPASAGARRSGLGRLNRLAIAYSRSNSLRPTLVSGAGRVISQLNRHNMHVIMAVWIT
jgi:hypothetical protein